MALPVLDAVFASSADLPRRQMLSKWLTEQLGSGSVSEFYTLPERLIWAKIAVAAGCSKFEVDYISLPARYVWSDIYNAVAGGAGIHNDWSEKEALGHIAAAYRGDTANPALVATYINWPWRYQVAAIINNFYAPTYLVASGGGIWRLTVDSDGIVTTELMASGSGVASVLVKSPNSSVFSLTVDNSGILTVAPSGSSTTRQWISYLSGSNIFLIKVDNSGILTTEKQ